MHAPRRCIQRREQLVRGVCTRPRENIEQCTFAGIRVPDQRNRHNVRALTRTALHVALARQTGEPVLEQFYALAEQTAVCLELRLAGAAQANAALLPLQVGPPAHEPSRQAFELCKLDLQLALMALRALGENVEDQTDAVNDPAFQALFKVAFLRRRQL